MDNSSAILDYQPKRYHGSDVMFVIIKDVIIRIVEHSSS